MIPVKIDVKEYDYSDFQPDQILTADNLNHLFNFLDLQERLTRTNLIGIGIVCGLQASRTSDGKSVIITKGTCVTSHGYLMAHGIENSEEPIIYKLYRDFHVHENERYDVFVAGSTQRYAMWELMKEDDQKNPGTNLSSAFLDDKVCLLFYEIKDEKAKTCDPTSCDDKGVQVTITVYPLLVTITDADKIIAQCNTKANATGSGEVFPGIFSLPEIKLPRFDVQATTLETTSDIYEAYQKVFSKTFVEGTGNALKQAYTIFKPLLKTQTTVFDNFNNQFAFLHNGTIAGNNLLHFQYFYDLFCDLLLAYREWRDAAHTIAGMCTPPEALFPRHVLLGTFVGMSNTVKSKYRNYFIASPIFHSCCHSYQEFQSLFLRMVRIITNPTMPVPVSAGKPIDSNIRITPSVVGNFTLADRAIPYYYKPGDGSPRLLDVWNHELTSKGRERMVLHYNPSYNTVDDFVKNPLLYDIEPFNFFRVEGHIGKKFDSALATIQDIRNKHRLPFDIVAVTVDSLTGKINPADFPCHFIELEAQYEVLRAELMCTFCKVIACLYRQPLRFKLVSDKILKLKSSTLKLIKECKDELLYDDTSVGLVYEAIHPMIIKMKDNLEMVKIIKLIRTTGAIEEGGRLIENDEAVVTITQIIRAIVLLAETVPADLTLYNHDKVLVALGNLKKLLDEISDGKDDGLNDRFKNRECIKDLYDLCDLAPFAVLYKEYIARIEKLKQMQSLKEFGKHHPGLQHKGGVPSGGTFVLVYRDLEVDVAPVKDVAEIAVGAVQPGAAIIVGATAPTSVALDISKLSSLKKITAKEKVMIIQKVNLLKAKGMSKVEIESVLGVGIFDFLKEKGVFDNLVSNFEHGLVVADFYLPYLCCSDCPPIHFVINIPPPKISFALDKSEYCIEDTEEHFFLASPIGGAISKPDSQKDTVVDKGDGTFVFLPVKATIPATQQNVSISFTYMAEGLSQTISVTVYRKPEVKIVAKENPNNPLQFDIGLDKPERVTASSWNFGDGTFSTDITPPSHTFLTGGEYVVSTEVKNGVCGAKPESVLITAKSPDAVKVELSAKDICHDVKEVPFTIIPPGGTLTGENFNESPAGSGKYLFLPSEINMQGLSKRTISFNYISLQNQTATFAINVFEKPEGISQVDQTGTLQIKVNFDELKNTSEVRIDFGDGKDETYPVGGLLRFVTPSHLYPQKGEYNVKTTLINGTCITKLPDLPISVTGEPQVARKECLPIDDPAPDFKVIKSEIKEIPVFKEYKPLADLDRFFKALSGAVDNNGNIDLKFFDQEPIQPAWITLLPFTPAAARSVSIELIIMLTRILLSASCLRKDDLDGRLQEVFNALLAKLKELKTLNAKDRDALLALIDDMRNELKNIRNNKEEEIKKNYVDALNALIEAIKAVL